MDKWDQEWLLILHRLLSRKGGYEIVNVLMNSEGNERIENEIKTETEGPASTVEEWLQQASEYGLVESEVGENDGKMVRIWQLNRERVPNEIEHLIKDRGKVWRDKHRAYSNVSRYSKWLTGPDLGDIIMSLDPDENGLVNLEDINFGENKRSE